MHFLFDRQIQLRKTKHSHFLFRWNRSALASVWSSPSMANVAAASAPDGAAAVVVVAATFAPMPPAAPRSGSASVVMRCFCLMREKEKKKKTWSNERAV